MAKILNFKPNNIEQLLKDCANLTDKTQGMAIALKLKDGSFMTGYYNMGFADKAEACAHMTVDYIDQMIQANCVDTEQE